MTLTKQVLLTGRAIRSAVVRGPDIGNILVCDLEKEKDDIAHSYIFKWQSGNFYESFANFDAHSICFITRPEPAVIFLAGGGEYGVHYRKGSLAGDILEDSQPPSKQRRLGGFRSVSEIGGRAYAVGLRGMVYRLDMLNRWTRIDDGLPERFNIQAIHGFQGSDIYAVGRNGELWHYDGDQWSRYELPTNVNLTSLKCAGNDKVYIGGHGGTLIEGRNNAWSLINHGATEDDIWDVEWFKDKVYASTMHSVYELHEEELVPVDFGRDRPKTFYQLSVASDVMWSNGEHDIMSFDGSGWVRVV